MGTTCKYYDGLDRLVEVAQPYDSRQQENPRTDQEQKYEFFGYRWMNRYDYDLSQSGGAASLTISDSTGSITGIVAYGGLYKTQECMHNFQSGSKLVSLSQGGQYSACNFDDVRGTSFDGLNRVVAKFELAYGTSPVTLNTYDCSGQYDELCTTKNAVGQKITYSYDQIARVNEVSFNSQSSEPNRTYTFDADGRTITITDAVFGVLSYKYDADGNKLRESEPPLETAASNICYSYYPDDLREYVSIGTLAEACDNITNNENPATVASVKTTFLAMRTVRITFLLTKR